MKVRFWGTRGSIAKAGPSTVRYGGNTSCVEVRSAAGDVLVLDCGTGAHGLGVSLAREGISRGHVLISHTHWDHIQGLPFFAPLFVPGNQWDIYGPRGLGPSLGEVLSGQMEYTYFPITPENFEAEVAYHDLIEGVLEIGDIRVTTRYLNHPALTLAYRIEADGVVIVYATDHEPHDRRLACGGAPLRGSDDERHGQFLADADLVIHDTQYTAAEYPKHRGWGHSTMEYVVDLARAGAVRRLAMFHHDPLRHDAALDELVDRARVRVREAGDRMEVFGAAEGNLVEVPGRERRARAALVSAPMSSAAPALPRGLALVVAAADPELVKLVGDAAGADEIGVRSAGSVDEALALLAESTPSLVIAELGLPGGGGEALCRRLQASAEPGAVVPPVVLVAPRGVSPSLECGAAEALELPFSSIYARTRIRAWCLRQVCRWRAAPRPEDEDARVRALEALGLKEGEAEERFDRHTRIAARLFRVRHAAINLIDGARQWTKSTNSGPRPPLPRDISICAHAVLGEDALQVVDVARSDFADNLALRGAAIRFYCGLPLAAPGGERVGTLCLMDIRPRELDADELGLLRDLGQMVERELAAGEDEA